MSELIDLPALVLDEHDGRCWAATRAWSVPVRMGGRCVTRTWIR